MSIFVKRNKRKEVLKMKEWLKVLLQAIAAAIGAILGVQ